MMYPYLGARSDPFGRSVTRREGFPSIFEEYKSKSEELGEVRKKRLEHDKVNESKDELKQRFDEILETINSRDSLLEEFDEQIFNTLVEKIEILTPTHFIFELKSGLRVEEIERI